jgi:hypothetical protein
MERRIEVSTEEAMLVAARGLPVFVLAPCGNRDNWTSMTPAMLEELLRGCIFFANEKDLEEEDPEEDDAEDVSEPESIPVPEPGDIGPEETGKNTPTKWTNPKGWTDEMLAVLGRLRYRDDGSIDWTLDQLARYFGKDTQDVTNAICIWQGRKDELSPLAAAYPYLPKSPSGRPKYKPAG